MIEINEVKLPKKVCYIVSWDFPYLEKRETVKRLDGSKATTKFPHKYCAYLFSVTQKYIHAILRDEPNVVMVGQSCYGVEPQTATQLKGTFEQLPRYLTGHIEGQLTKARYSKNRKKVTYYQNRLDYLNDTPLKATFSIARLG